MQESGAASQLDVQTGPLSEDLPVHYETNLPFFGQVVYNSANGLVALTVENQTSNAGQAMRFEQTEERSTKTVDGKSYPIIVTHRTVRFQHNIVAGLHGRVGTPSEYQDKVMWDETRYEKDKPKTGSSCLRRKTDPLPARVIQGHITQPTQEAIAPIAQSYGDLATTTGDQKDPAVERSQNINHVCGQALRLTDVLQSSLLTGVDVSSAREEQIPGWQRPPQEVSITLVRFQQSLQKVSTMLVHAPTEQAF